MGAILKPTSSIAEKASGVEVYRILSRSLNVDWREYVALVADKVGGGYFPVLVGTILSQNTNDKNSIEAFMSLKSRVGVRIEDILRASVEEIGDAIRKAGLWRRKAETIKRVAEFIASRGGEEYLAREDPMRLREELLRVEGVGFKTIDVFLSLARRTPVFAVDTHAMRVALRWGLASKRDYETVSRALLDFFGPDIAEEAHRLIIALGRRYCRARNPRCNICPLTSLCPSSSKV